MTGGERRGRNTGAEAQPTVLIGFLSRRNPGPIPTVTKAFMEGLGDRYAFVPHIADRRFGNTRTSGLNPLNGYYLLKHYALWCVRLLRHRPAIAHYPVTSFWNLEKSLLFLHTARRFGARTVGHLHGGAFIEFWNRLGEKRRGRAFRALQKLDAFVVLSEGWGQRVVQNVGLDPSRVFIVSNPIDAAFEDAALKLSVEREARTILSLGVMDREKGLLDIIAASGRVLRETGYRLILAGPERKPGVAAQAKRMIAAEGIGDLVTIAGGVWGQEKLDLFERSTIFLLASYQENFPLVTLEAAAAGQALIVSPVGAIPEFFSHGRSAFFVQPGDVGGIASAIATVTGDPGLRSRLGEAGRAVFRERLARKRILSSLNDVYRHVLED